MVGSSSRLVSRFCTLSSIFSGLVCKIRSMVLWPAPTGALGAIANLVVATGWSGITQLLILMLGF